MTKPFKRSGDKVTSSDILEDGIKPGSIRNPPPKVTVTRPKPAKPKPRPTRPSKPATTSQIEGDKVGASDLNTGRPIKIRKPKTFTDGQGNVREIGTGKIVKAAPSRGGSSSGRFTPSSDGSGGGTPSRTVRRPRTFTDASGTVRRVRSSSASRGGTGANQGRPAGPDPLDKLVDEIIASRIAPIQDERRNLREQSAGDINQIGRLNEGFQQNLTGLRADTSADMGAAMARAMELRGYSADTLAKGQEWAKSLMAPTNGGTGDAEVAASSAQTLSESNAAFDAMGREVASRGTSLNDWLAKQSAIGTTQANEQVQQQMLVRQAAERDLNSRIAQEKGQRAEMLYGMRQAQQEADLKARVAEAEWGIEAQKQASLDAYRQGQLQLGADRNALQAARLQFDAAKAAKGKQIEKGRYGLPAKWDKTVDGVLDDINKQLASDAGLNRPWRTSFQALVDRGIPANTAAFLATRWFRDSITSSTPANIRVMLANRGVPVPAQQRIIIDNFGPQAWKQALDGSGLKGAVATAGRLMGQ